MRIYGFGVGEAIAICPIPLVEDENILFELDIVYHRTFKRGRWGNLVDYETEPLRMHTYSPADQEIIRRHMAALQQR